jgi:hypothetical protein
MDMLWCLLSTHSMQGCFYRKKLFSRCNGILVVFISTYECFYHDLSLSLSLSMRWRRKREEKGQERDAFFCVCLSLSLFLFLYMLGDNCSKNLGLEVYPVSYSSHFDFIMILFFAVEYFKNQKKKNPRKSIVVFLIL